MIRYLYLIGCLFVNIALQAQAPVANFTSTNASGCGPLGVFFTDQSTGNPKFWNWEFTNDQTGLDGQLSTQQNPGITFSTPGRYTVKLVVRNNDGTNGITKTGYINVLPSPVASFIADKTEACQPATISFTDKSTSTSGTINSWSWIFGDGGTSTQTNPTHTFKDNGFYSITLKVTSTSGCPGQTTAGRYIRVVSGVKPDFNPVVDGSCVAPYATTFSNQTSGPGTLSYVWRFHDGTTSTVASPVKSYNTAGTYNIKLVATSSLGCSDSIQKPLTITGTDVKFTLPTGACVNTPATFTNTSATGAVSNLWDFGDGTTSTQASPTKTYANPGTYTVSLTATYKNCSSKVSQSLVVMDPPAVDFSADRTAACKAPLSVIFSSNAPGATKWAWDFGDGSTATTANPSHTYTSNGEYNVTLTITNANNCTNTITKNAFIKITPPVISMTEEAEACVNSIYQPGNNIKVVSPDPISSYTWNWGDNTPDGTGINASHIYTSQNTYTVTLTVITVGGCSVTTSFPGAISAGDKITADFTADKLKICDEGSVQFTNASAVNGSSPAGDKFLWTFGDGSTATDQNPLKSFKGRGEYSVTLKVRNNGCYDTKTLVNYIEVLPPTARIEYKLVDCNDPLTFNFVSISDTSIAPATSSYNWEFGAAGAEGTSTETKTTVTFSNFGTYPVTLTVKDNNNSCTSTSTINLPVFKESATLSAPKSTICKNEVIRITASALQPQNIVKYEWQIDGGAFVERAASLDTSFPATGTYVITARLTDVNGCIIFQNTPLSIVVQGPTAKADFPLFKGCRNSVASFTDQSTALAGIASWNWTWGDGKSDVYNSLNTPFKHTYTDSGSFSVKLLITDQNNCSDVVEYIDLIKIRQPVAYFKAANTIFCSDSKLQFTDSSSGHGLTYLWDFGDGQTSTDQNPEQIYKGADRKYTVKLSIADDAGCKDETTKTDYIEIKSPKPAFTVSDSISLCRLFETKFTFAGQDYESFYWDFGDDATTETKNPTHFYNEYGNYTATLNLVGVGGCVVSTSRTIKVLQSDGSMIDYMVPPLQCNELKVDFTLIPPPTVDYIFLYGDGVIDSSRSKTLSHTYASLGSFTPKMTMTDRQGCIGYADGFHTLKIIGALPFFGQDRKAFCDQGDVVFTEYIQKNDPVTSFGWNFGDGQSLDNQNTVHHYDAPGTYITSLTVNTVNCPGNTYYDTVRVYRTPKPAIIGSNGVCVNNLLLLAASTVVKDTAIAWKWTTGNNTSADSTITLRPVVTGTVSVMLQATNKIGCFDTTSITVTTFPRPVITIAPSITTPVGYDIKIPVTYNDPVLDYAWTPSTYLSCTNCAVPTVVQPKFAKRYVIEVTDKNGCTSKDSIQLNTICNGINYFIPNTFSPNGDGVNDWFYPRGTFLTNVQTLRIFNRWGEIVFEKRNFPPNNMTDGWNGTYKGKPAASDAYVYILELICDNAQIVSLRGNVTLIR